MAKFKLFIDGVPVQLTKNLGPVGSWKYNQVFNESLTDDIYQMIGPKEQMDDQKLFRIIYLMGGFDTKYNFLDFLGKIPKTFNVLMNRTEILDAAVDAYLPFEAQGAEEEPTTK